MLHHPLETIEMNWVARNIRERGISLGECAILSRNINLLQVAAKSLHKAELVPYRNERKSEFEYPLLCFCRSLIPKSHIASMTDLHRNIYKLYVHKALRWMLLIMPVLIPFFWENGLDLQDILILQAAFSVSLIALEVPSGYVADVIGRKFTLIIGSAIGAVAFVLYATAYAFWEFLLVEILLDGLDESAYQVETMQGGGFLIQFFVLTGGRIEVALRIDTQQTFNPKSVHKISEDEISTQQTDR